MVYVCLSDGRCLSEEELIKLKEEEEKKKLANAIVDVLTNYVEISIDLKTGKVIIGRKGK